MKLWHKLTILWIAVALIHLVWGTAVILGGGTLEDAKAATYSLNALTIILISLSVFAMAKDKGWFQNDERTRKTAGIAFMYAYIITMVFLAMLLFVEHFKILQLTAIQVIGAVFVVMLIAANLLLGYYDRSGDAQ
ncbi:MAG: hypothetical protein MPEBLZ_03287 [Candidatus Methanoperedens nitroreducens]|uniref:Uncharacterized protein n=1 Tax=Candidatus Methanoperedens nitratireducens TaxID=1392998 RepID=A0A0P7ZC25_9EURY|nr:hypothetical protein [Candidatus Methanoperedens sp. BLZ2]KAB2945610.1 MAG: hypothetical protein F9K14_10145 [Candidatus Methanoperedens sp.]KPQ42160.1 MAG: hypothetical protein MPEBLZ_03287 [Candidatus Methanoperedens sp. BLZ1]MBZ0176098.1 hypothetical protein [Candidatus Methanoperedens nitroreducens]MCX9079379.1 hypothetical protein [Candidatus Methanoperedens sp.]